MNITTKFILEPALLKSVFISSKRYKKQLLIKHDEVSTLQTFLKNTIKNDVLIINTNLGLDVYYQSSSDCSAIIKNSFLLLITKNGKNANEYRIVSLNSIQKLRGVMKNTFIRLCSMPLIFKSYTKSMLHQLNGYFSKNTVIIKELFIVWQGVLNILCQEEIYVLKIKQFQKNLQSFFIELNYNPLLKQLIKDSTSSLRCN